MAIQILQHLHVRLRCELQNPKDKSGHARSSVMADLGSSLWRRSIVAPGCSSEYCPSSKNVVYDRHLGEYSFAGEKKHLAVPHEVKLVAAITARAPGPFLAKIY